MRNRPSPPVLAAAIVLGSGLLTRADFQTEFPSLARVAKDYAIRVDVAEAAVSVPTTYGAITGQPAGRAELDRYVPLFAAEFQMYPAELVQRAKLRRVVLCRDLAFASQRRNAVPDFEHDVLCLDVSRGAEHPTYLRKVIHHEFFHIVDLRDDGLLYADDRWSALNPPGFRYGRGGKNAQDNRTTSLLTDRVPGFLNHYSTTAVEEDKAEVFANLMVEPGYVAVRADKEPVLAAKVKRMKELVREFCPAADERFWKRAAEKERSR